VPRAGEFQACLGLMKGVLETSGIRVPEVNAAPILWACVERLGLPREYERSYLVPFHMKPGWSNFSSLLLYSDNLLDSEKPNSSHHFRSSSSLLIDRKYWQSFQFFADKMCSLDGSGRGGGQDAIRTRWREKVRFFGPSSPVPAS